MEIQREKNKKISNSDDLITCRGNSVQIPSDLIMEILKELPVKALSRFMSVSEEYKSIIRNRDFKKSYLIKSSTRPQRLIFTLAGVNSGRHFFFSLLQPQDRGELPEVTYLMSCSVLPYNTVAPSVHGLICHGLPSNLMVYNPSTRRSITLPKIHTHGGFKPLYHHIGYDLIGGDYKMLSMMKGMHVEKGRFLANELQVLTLGKESSWRMIEDFQPHCLCTNDTPDICINGVLYYVALLDTALSHVIMSFDVRFEKFDVIQGPDPCVRPRLTRYEGKVAVLFAGIGDCSINLWVLEDAAKHEWSKMSYVSSTSNCDTHFFHHVACANDAGEIVLAPEFVFSKPFDVLYYHPKKNTMRSVVIEGIRELNVPLWDEDPFYNIVTVFPGQVDNLMFL